MIRRLAVGLPRAGLLETLAGGSRVLGLRAGRTAYSLFRETWFDTRGGALAERGLSLCLRMEAAGGVVLELTREAATLERGVAELVVSSCPVVGGGLYSTLRGESEVATAVRDFVDPLELRPVLALDVDRESRELKRGWVGKALCTAHFDRVLAHRGGATRALEEIVLVEAAAGPSCLEGPAAELEERHGLASDGRSTVRRALDLLERGRAARPDALREVRMALVVHRGGEVALVERGGVLTVPHARGSGDRLASAFASEVVRRALHPQDLELAGFAPAREAGPELEVWIHECARGDDVPGVVWIPVGDLLGRIGNPGLRDPVLVAATLLLVRSEAGRRLLAGSGRGEHAAVLPARLRVAGATPSEDDGDFLDVELSVLDFHQRVLEMAEDPGVPLLERFRFLSIVAGNVDEFFTVRVGRLKGERDPDQGSGGLSLTSTELLDLIAIRVRGLEARQQACLRDSLLPALARAGVHLRLWTELEADVRAELSRRFEADVFPLLTPRALTTSPGQPFPRLESLALSLAVVLKGEEGAPTQVAHVPLPASLPRFLAVPGRGDLIAIEDVVAAHANHLFPALQVVGVHAFRVTRRGDVEIDEEAASSLLSAVEDEVVARPFKPVVRIEVHRGTPPEVRALLVRELRQERASGPALLGEHYVFEVDGLLGLRSLGQLAELGVPGGTYPAFTPVDPWPGERSVFDLLREGDRLVHHPYESFDGSVGRFLREAAVDPQVVAIKLTLYRTGRDSPFGDTLLEALRNGKEVSVFVEVKARFDEESNIQWTRRITEAGGHVVHGVVGFKTHAKTALVVRREEGGVARYVHVGTGNYNAATARVYTDLGLLTADPELGADLNDFFNELTGTSGPPVKRYRRLLVAPSTLAQRLTALIEREAEHAAAGRPARIQAKLNGLTDRRIIRALYLAARRGVEVDLVVRSVCTLRPRAPGLSERIRVRSILGRFLEHARIYHFANGGEEEWLIASADWRKRNLRERVEVAAPVLDPDARAWLRAILDAEFADPRAWELGEDGAWVRGSGPGPTAQEAFLSGARVRTPAGPGVLQSGTRLEEPAGLSSNPAEERSL